MATVIDQLIISLSLNATGFTQGQQQAIQQLRQFQSQATTSANSVQNSTQAMVNGFQNVTREILGLGAAFLGVSGLKDLVVGTVTAGANVDVLTKSINLNVEALNRWQNVGRQFGVTAEATAAAIGNIATLQQQLRQGKVGPEALGGPSLFALAGITTDELANLSPFDLLQRVAGGTRAHPADAAGLLAGTPFAPLQPQLQAPDLNKRLDESLTLTREQAKAAQDVRDQFVQLTELLEGRFNKALLENIQPIKELIEAIRKLAHGDFSGAQDLNVKLGGQADEGLHGIGSWIWGMLSKPGNLPATGQGSPLMSSGDGGGGLPLPRGRPFSGAYSASDVSADAERGNTGNRGTGRWIAPYLNTPIGHESLNAGGFDRFGDVNTDNSSAIHIAHVSITPPPGTDANAWASTFISSVTAQASSGSR